MTNTPQRPRLLSFSPASEKPTRTAGDDRVIAGADHAHHDDFGGLHRDLIATGAAMDRRGLFRIAARLGVGVSALSIVGCSGNTETSPSSSSSLGGKTSSTCSRVPEETAGLYPGDGSNGPMVLNLSGVVRSDLRSSFAGLSGTATGVPLTIQLTIVSASTCAPLAGRAVYLWHCDALGRYSLYSSGATNQNYLRGVQEADAGGKVTFTSIYPVFSDGSALELATIAGSVASGFTATLTVAV